MLNLIYYYLNYLLCLLIYISFHYFYSMETLNTVAKTLPFLPTKKIKDLEINKKYKISKCKKILTKFGEKMVLELDASFDVFLPNKVNAFLMENTADEDKLKQEIDTRDVYLKYLGNNIIEFE